MVQSSKLRTCRPMPIATLTFHTQQSQTRRTDVAFLGFGGMLSAMRIQAVESVLGTDGEELLTTGEAARLLNTSRQHVVDLCERGDLPFVTTGSHRRVRRADVELLRTRTQRLTRDQERSLWLGHAIAGKVVLDPPSVLKKAKRNLIQLERVHSTGAAKRWLAEWRRLLDGPVEGILEALTSPAPRARELRQNSPFAGVLTQEERQRALAAFGSRRGRRP